MDLILKKTVLGCYLSGPNNHYDWWQRNTNKPERGSRDRYFKECKDYLNGAACFDGLYGATATCVMYNQEDLLGRLFCKLGMPIYFNFAILCAMANDNRSMINRLISYHKCYFNVFNEKLVVEIDTSLILAARYGHTRLFDCILEGCQKQDANKTMDRLYSSILPDFLGHGETEYAMHMFTLYHSQALYYRMLELSCFRGDIGSFENLMIDYKDQYGQPRFNKCLKMAVRGGQPSMLSHLVSCFS